MKKLFIIYFSLWMCFLGTHNANSASNTNLVAEVFGIAGRPRDEARTNIGAVRQRNLENRRPLQIGGEVSFNNTEELQDHPRIQAPHEMLSNFLVGTFVLFVSLGILFFSF